MEFAWDMAQKVASVCGARTELKVRSIAKSKRMK